MKTVAQRGAGQGGDRRHAFLQGLALTAFALTVGAAAPAAAQFRGKIEDLKGQPVVPARLPDGKPNWTGFWIPPASMLDVYRGPSGLAGQPIGANTRSNARQDIPALKSPYKEQYAEALRKAAISQQPDPIAACFPVPMPAIMGATYGLEIIQTPKIIAMTSEWQASTRRIWMDVKEHPPLDELDPTFSGHSIGHWEGDVLVVDTVGLRADAGLDTSYLPHSDKTHITERFSMPSPGILVDDITVDDPDLFEGGPWKYRNVYLHKPDLRLKEYVCLENNRNVDAQGRNSFE